MRTHLLTIPALLGALGAAALVAPVEAGGRARPHAHPGEGAYVVAYSRFGNGSIGAPVRATRVGLEVRLPGGTWVPCRRACSETLRVETIDRWENWGPDGRDNEAGILGDLTVRRAF